MRLSRQLGLVSFAATATLVAGPLVGTASAAVTATSTTPSSGTVIPDAAHRPNQVTVTYSEQVYSPAATTPPADAPKITITRNGTPFACTLGPTSGPTAATITCDAPQANFVDGSYTVNYSATATNPLSGSVSGTFSFLIDTTAPVLQSTSPANGHTTHGDSIGATYDEALAAVPTSSMTVKNLGGSGVTLAGTSSLTNGGKTLTWTPSSTLTEAGNPYVATATVQDLYGHATTSTWNFTVDTTPPAKPTVTAPNYVNSASVTAATFYGTAEPLSTVTVTAVGGATKVVTTTADGSGAWSTTADLSTLTDGPVSVSATATDEAGNVSPVSDAASSTKDTTAPTLSPTITVTPSAVTKASTAVTVSGSAGTPGATDAGDGIAVTIANGGSSLSGSGVGAADHSYAVGPIDTASLPDGTLTVTVTATDPAGNTTTHSTTVTKDTVPPSVLTLSMTSPVNAANQASRTVSGTADPTAVKVTLWVTDGGAGSTAHVDVVPDAGHAFSHAFDLTSLADGPLTVHAIAYDAAGNPSTEVTAAGVKDTVAPSAAVFTAPAYVNIATAPAFGLSGTAEAASAVHLVITDSTHTVTADTVTGQNGAWAVSGLDLRSLSDGTVQITATVTDAAGNATTGVAHTTNKDTVAPAKPTGISVDNAYGATSRTVSGTGTVGDTIDITATSDGGPGTATGSSSLAASSYAIPVTVSGLPDGTLSFVVTETDPAGNTSPASSPATAYRDTTVLALVSSAPAAGAFVTDQHVFAATYNEQLDLASSTVTVVQDSTGAQLAHGAASLSTDLHTISVTMTDPSLPEGAYTATFTVKNHVNGDTDSTTSVVHITVDRTAPTAPTVTSLANATPANVTAVPVAVTAAEGYGSLTVTVTDAAAHTATATVAMASGTSVATTVDVSALTDGPITATAVQTDRAGNASAASAGLGATKDTVVPAAPGVGFDGAVSATHTTVRLSGTGENGATLDISVDDTDGATTPVTGQTTVSNGTWSKTLDLSSLSDGTLTATATQTDGVGNVSPRGTATTMKDTVAPTAPGVQFNGPVSAASAHAVTVSGTGENGDTLTVSVDDTSAGTTPVLATTSVSAGHWSAVLDLSTLADGTLTATATQTDGVGNVSPAGQATVGKDTLGPSGSVGFTGTLSAANTVAHITGTGENGLPVSVTLDDADTATAPVTGTAAVSAGHWTLDLNASGLSDGTLTVVASQTDASGNRSANWSATTTKDTVAPAAPTLTSAGPVTATDRIAHLSGTGEDGATVSVTLDDADSTTAPLTGTATVAAGHWALNLDASSLVDGALVATAHQTDPVDNASPAASTAFMKDTVAPAVTLRSPTAPFTIYSTLTATYAGSDANGVSSYDVRYRQAAYSSGFGAYVYPSAWQGTTTTNVQLVTKPGVTVCFSVRSHDAFGNVSTWSPQHCTSLVLDDRALTASSAWSRSTTSGYYYRTFTQTKSAGAALTRSSTQVDRIAVLATRCPTCGSVAVYVGSAYVGTLNLTAATTQARVLMVLPAFRYRTGTVTVKSIKAGALTRIDGLGLTRV